MSYDTETALIDALYALYEQPLYFAAYNILHDTYMAEDAVQEAFLRLIRHRDKIQDPAAPQTRAYVYKTLKSAALDLYRAQKRQSARCCTLDDAVAYTAEEMPTDTLCAATLSDLPQKYAAVLRCLFVSELTVRETAAVLKISEACVRKRCERARKRLKAMKEGELL